MSGKFARSRHILLLSLTVFLSSATRAQDSLSQIPVWRGQMVAMELIQFDSLKAEFHSLQKSYRLIQGIVLEQGVELRAKDQQLAERAYQLGKKDEQVQILTGPALNAERYKRQRNGLILGIAGVVTLKVGYEVVRSLLER